MKYRKLRIAWSVAWGILAVLLFLLYVRSHSWLDGFGVVISKDRYVTVISAGRRIHVATATFPPGRMQGPWSIRSRRLKDSGLYPIEDHRAYQGVLGVGLLRTSLFEMLAFPHWLPAVLILGVAYLPWLSLIRRFSLRTLLIGTTLFALVLGLIVWMSRPG
jgi:hypothetical protein